MERPRVRYLDIQPYGDKFLVSDPFGLVEPLLVSWELLLIMSLMDGTRNEEEIKAEFLRKTGNILTHEDYRQVLKILEENYLLLNDSFRSKLNSLKEEMLNRGVRKAFHAGQAYPADAQKLKEFLSSAIREEEKENLVGILVPHMDMRVAIETYGKVYSKAGNSPQLVVILGVSHYIHQNPFSVCPLDLETPLGTLETDKEVVEKLKSEFSYDIFEDILSYQKEHSIEFQAVFIKHLFPEAKVLPAIVSYGDKRTLRDIAEKLFKALEGKELLIVSSVDMSHVGKKFGDPASYDPYTRDMEYIDLLGKLDAEGSFELLESDNNKTRIDGQFTNFVFLELIKMLGAEKGKPIDYQQFYEEPTDSIVSYAGMSFS